MTNTSPLEAAKVFIVSLNARLAGYKALGTLDVGPDQSQWDGLIELVESIGEQLDKVKEASK